MEMELAAVRNEGKTLHGAGVSLWPRCAGVDMWPISWAKQLSGQPWLAPGALMEPEVARQQG